MEQKLANPAPLGLMGFGMTTVLLNIHNAGFFPVSAMILAMGIFYGGIAQVIAGIMELKKATHLEQLPSPPMDCSGSPLLHSGFFPTLAPGKEPEPKRLSWAGIF